MSVEIPDEFLCPISYELMEDPVLLGGHTFERSALTAWLAQRSINPLTNEPVNSNTIVSNFALRDAIRRWKTEHASVATPVAKRPEAKNPQRTFRVERNGKMLRIFCESDEAQKLCLIAVLDVSGSMDGPAGQVEGVQESSGQFSRLDLVKHSTRTVAAMLAERNTTVPTYFGCITFSDTAKTRIPLRQMTSERLDEVNTLVDTFAVEGGTNIWDGLRAGLDMASYAARMHPDANIQVMLLTDGEPTPSYNPPEGIARSLERKLVQIPCHPSVSVFGFGTNLSTSLLNEIVTIGNGVYGYSSDASMVGTVFVHYCAAALSTCARNIWINDTYLGNLTVGAWKSTSMEVGSSVEIQYDNQQKASVRVSDTSTSLDFEELCERILWKLRPYVSDSSDLSPAIYDLLDIRKLALESKDPRCTSLAQDIQDPDPHKGQLSKAVSRTDWWRSWGANHFVSYLRALQMKQCPNFKDAAPQEFKKGFVRDMQEMGSALFDNLPAPKPSLGGGYGGPVDMTQYNNANGGCISGMSPVKMNDDSESLAKNLKRGDIVLDGYRILAVIRTALRGLIGMTELPGGLVISPWHPVQEDTSKNPAIWEFPIAVRGAVTKDVEISEYYNFVLDSGHVLHVGQWAVCTLGHGVEGPVIGHPYLGTQAVVEDLKRHPAWNSGLIQLYPLGIQRDESGKIKKIC